MPRPNDPEPLTHDEPIEADQIADALEAIAEELRDSPHVDLDSFPGWVRHVEGKMRYELDL